MSEVVVDKDSRINGASNYTEWAEFQSKQKPGSWVKYVNLAFGGLGLLTILFGILWSSAVLISNKAEGSDLEDVKADVAELKGAVEAIKVKQDLIYEYLVKEDRIK